MERLLLKKYGRLYIKHEQKSTDSGDRTHDSVVKSHMLYQLSYADVFLNRALKYNSLLL